MSSVKTNERELASKIAQWFNEHIERNKFPFTSASNEAGVEVIDTTRFGDVVIWKNRHTNTAYSYFELKPPFSARENLETFRQKAIALQVKFAFTWDFQTLNVYKITRNKIELQDSEPTPVLNSIEDWLRGDKQETIKKYIHRICEELIQLHDTGKFSKFKPEKIYFINLTRNIVKQLIPDFEKFIRENHKQGKFKKEIDRYVIIQGISYPSDSEFYGIIARQRVYGLVTKIIFYLTIRRYFKELPDLYETKESDLNNSIKVAFAEAGKKDWQAVFSDDPIEELGIPENAQQSLKSFFEELKVYHFGELREDVVAELFEEIIDPEERHRLGQYFTKEDLVDLVIAAIVNNKDGIYADPTCGSGTFLIRLYDRLKYLSHNRKKHSEILSQIWGIDIGKFPAELSTINLFRQDVSNFENFPRILHKNIFEIYNGYLTEFPPLQSGYNFQKIKITIPEFNGFVGNFPFIRQEMIEKKDKGFKVELTKLLAEEYLFSYTKLFEINTVKESEINIIKQQPKEKQLKTVNDWIKKKYISLKLSGQADIYTYIYIHTATLLAKNGSFAIITSNSWMDVSYGSVLKEFFLDHFKIKFFISTWAESWFNASVNTVVTVLEKEDNQENRNENVTHFVKLKKNLTELIPYPDLQIDSIKRWDCIDGLIRTIETAQFSKKCKKITGIISALETDEMRIRLLLQRELSNEVNEKKELSKWGKYLRAPDVYFEILEQCKDKLVPLKKVADVRFGIKTGINDFFYLEPLKIVKKNTYSDYVEEPMAEYLTTGSIVPCRNARGWEGKIESKYLRKVIKSPKEAERITIDSERLKFFIFICNKNKSEIRKAGDYGALEYIEWGEKQHTQEGVGWEKVPSVKSRINWWDIGVNRFSDLFCMMSWNDRFLFWENDDLLADARLYDFYLKKGVDKTLISSLLNCTLTACFIELGGRANLGDGALDFKVYEAEEEIYLPDIKILNKKIKDKLIKLYSKISNRKIKSIFEEVKLKDRKELDSVVLEAIGLDAKEYLPRIYDGLCEMVRERLELPKMRKKQKTDKEIFSYNEVKQSVIKEVLKSNLKIFPLAFYTGEKNYDKLDFDIYPTNGEPLHYQSFFNQYEIKNTKNKTLITVDSEVKANFICILAKPGLYSLKIPTDEKLCEQIVKKHKRYINEIKQNLETNAKTKLHDWALAEKMTKEILGEYE